MKPLASLTLFLAVGPAVAAPDHAKDLRQLALRVRGLERQERRDPAHHRRAPGAPPEVELLRRSASGPWESVPLVGDAVVKVFPMPEKGPGVQKFVWANGDQWVRRVPYRQFGGPSISRRQAFEDLLGFSVCLVWTDPVHRRLVTGAPPEVEQVRKSPRDPWSTRIVELFKRYPVVGTDQERYVWPNGDSWVGPQYS